MTGSWPPWTSNAVSGGVQFGPVLQGRDIRATFQLPAEPPAALAPLPGHVAGFTGRGSELEALAELIDPSRPAGPVVSAVAGLAGVGKTALVVEAAHAALERGWFRGVLFIDLHGYDEVPVQPGQALDILLRALGVRADHIPPGPEERAGLYRSVLAQVPDPVLVIADNASSETQVLPLLPGAGPHRVVVTSRHTLAGLDARLFDVTVLDDAGSIALLEEAVRYARPEDERINTDRQAAGQLAAACGGLPLALQIVAAILKADPARRVSDLAAEFAEERARLQLLRYDDGSGSGFSVKAAFEMSYRRLDEPSARMFCLLALNPGPHLSTETAAYLADVQVHEARDVLAVLLKAHLLEPAPEMADRWRMHDLLRLYAREPPDADIDPVGRDRALDRLFDYYMSAAEAAGVHLLALPGAEMPDRFPDREGALAWLDTERPNLVATVFTAAADGRHPVASRLAVALADYFSWRRPLDDWLATAEAGLTSANMLGDLNSRAVALSNLGRAFNAARRFAEAISAHRKAAATWKILGNRRGEGVALHNLGVSLQGLRQFDEAIAAFLQDLEICRKAGDLPGEATTLNSLGGCLLEADRLDEAITALRDAAVIQREFGDRHGEGATLNNLAGALARHAIAESSAAEQPGAVDSMLAYLSIQSRKKEKLDEAITCSQQALTVFRETGDRYNEAMGLLTLAHNLYVAERLDESIAASKDAAVILGELGDRHGQGMTLTNIATALRRASPFDEAAEERPDEALAAEQDAARIFRETGDRYREAQALDNLGVSLCEAGRFDEASAAHRDAAAIFHEIGDRRGEGWALLNLCSALRTVRNVGDAITTGQRAVVIFRDLADQPLLGKALVAHGAALHDADRFEEAITAQQEAVAIFRETRDLHTEGRALYDLGLCLRQLRLLDEAIAAYEKAAAIGRGWGDRMLQRQALISLGLSLQEADRFDEANTTHQDAAEVLRTTGNAQARRWAQDKLKRARAARRRR